VAATVAFLASAAPVGAGAPTATSAGEELVVYLTQGKLKPSKRISYRAACSADCQLSVSTTLVLKGPNLGPASDVGLFAAGQIAEPFLKPNKTARGLIKANLGASKLRTSITATNTLTGEVDRDRRTFKFKG
jgi:hypothetical protein